MKPTIFRSRMQTPVGRMFALATPSSLIALEFDLPNRDALLDGRVNRFAMEARIEDKKNDIIRQAFDWLDSYFEGERPPEVPPLTHLGTSFEVKVWKQMLLIPLGATLSYGEMAKRVKTPQAFRAVGNASRKNNIAIIVPCHRVIGSNGKLTGYGGGLDKKEWLLRHESTYAPARGYQPTRAYHSSL